MFLLPLILNLAYANAVIIEHGSSVMRFYWIFCSLVVFHTVHSSSYSCLVQRMNCLNKILRIYVEIIPTYFGVINAIISEIITTVLINTVASVCILQYKIQTVIKLQLLKLESKNVADCTCVALIES